MYQTEKILFMRCVSKMLCLSCETNASLDPSNPAELYRFSEHLDYIS